MGKGDGRRVENAELVAQGWPRCDALCTYRRGPFDQPQPRRCVRCSRPEDTEKAERELRLANGSVVTTALGGEILQGAQQSFLTDHVVLPAAELSELQSQAEIATHLRAVLPLVYDQMVRELESANWTH